MDTNMQDVPQLGALRPPRIYLASIVSGALLGVAVPLPFVPETLALPIGASLAAIAIALLAWAAGKFRAAGTPVPARAPTTTIVRTGPYRFSRNPIYLAYSLFQLGLAVGLDNGWLLATLAGAMALIHHRVIPREEEYLERKFGSRYSEYRRSVRRWL
jgi:protein-S-isoprenylcysteine O-methyltransferase Ste14